MTVPPRYRLVDLSEAAGQPFEARAFSGRWVVGKVGYRDRARAAMLTLGTSNVLTILEPRTSHAIAVNEAGVVAGFAGHTSDLGTLGGDDSLAFAINDAGDVVGDAEVSTDRASGSSITHAFLSRRGSFMQSLGTLGGERSSARGINRDALVVGYSTTEEGEFRAFLWAEGRMHDLGTLEGAGGATFAEALPGIRVQRLSHLAVVVDTSGSISNHELSDFFSEIHGLWRQGADVTVVDCDAAVQRVYPYSGTAPSAVAGRGGTRIDPAFEYLRHPTRYPWDGCIYLTDGEAPIPETRPPCRILWVLSERAKRTLALPFGTDRTSRPQIGDELGPPHQ
jgi:probable HAF family extracellular repeat protein